MIISKKKSKFPPYIILTLISLILIWLILIEQKKINLFIQNFTEDLMSYDPGFSSPRNLVENDNYFLNKSESLSKIKLITSNVPKIINYKFKGKNDQISNLEISLKFENLQRILNDRKLAINNGYLDNPNYVNANIIFDQKKYKAEVRLKGNISDHWMSHKRMSLRIKLKDGGSILGFNEFSIQKPRARQYPYEQAFQNILIEGGNLAANYNYSYVKFNGDKWGLMLIEEEISKEFLEKQGRKDSIVFRFSDDKKRLKSISNYHPSYRISDEKLFATLVKEKKYLANIVNRKFYTYILEQRLKEKHSEIYSISSHMKSFIASLFWNNQHTLFNSNSKYYFNPYTLQLEPITADQLHFSPYKSNLSEVLENIALTEVYKQVLSSNIDETNKNIHFKSTEELFDDAEVKINKHHKYFPLDVYKKDGALQDNINLLKNNKKVFYEWIDSHEIEQKEIFEQKLGLFSAESTLFPEHIQVRHYNDGKILFFNLLPEPVIINKIEVSNKSINQNKIVIPGYRKGNYTPYILQTGLTGIQDNNIFVETIYKDQLSTTLAYPTMVAHDLNNPLLMDTSNEFDFINKLGANTYQIRSGYWEVSKPIIIDGDLHIMPGTNISFSNDSFIIVKGSLKAIGTEISPINFQALSDSWKGLYILNSKDKSFLENVSIGQISALEDNLLNLTGAITFYNTTVDFKDVRIFDIKAEDAINFVNSVFSINSIQIENSLSDGIDSDFSTGQVTNSLFMNIGGDALDFSGSNASIQNISVKNVNDKAVSAGEKSFVTIHSSQFENVTIGVASKDGSNVEMFETSIENYDLYAAMTYQKKSFYDVPTMNLRNCNISSGNAFMRQKKSILAVDDIVISESEFNLDELNVY
jgi:hypothetical protein